MIQFAKPDISEAEILAAETTLRSGWITNGPRTKQFAKMIMAICGSDHVVCYDSCTAALEMCLRALGVGPGDEVITTPYTYSATAEVIRNVGAKIVFCDLEQGTFEMNYELLPELVTERTKAVIPVDIGGIPCNYAELFHAISQKTNLFKPTTPLQRSIGRIAVIADAAHSFGASYNGCVIGTVADFTCFSFHALKSITTGGEGGAAVWKNFERINNDRLEEKLSLLGDHGQTGKGITGIHGREWEYDIELFGYNHIMTDIDAAIGMAQLSRYSEISEKRKMLVKAYEENLPTNVLPSLNHQNGKYVSSMHLFPIRIPHSDEARRNAIFAKMLDAGIQCNVHYKPLPMFTAYIRQGFNIKDYPIAYETFSNLLTLPFHTFLEYSDIEYICDTLGKAVAEA